MSWKDRLLGKTSPSAPATTQPERRSQWEVIAAQKRRAGASNRSLFDVLRGRAPAGQVVCPQGHPVLPGSSTCTHGHWVG